MPLHCRRLSLALAAGVLALVPVAALAQTSPQTIQPPATSPQVIPPPVAPGSPRPSETIPEKRAPAPDAHDDAQQSLSDKLGRTDGVIKPPTNTDPGIVTPAPAPGATTMPVIPPPGSPGGRQDVTPK